MYLLQSFPFLPVLFNKAHLLHQLYNMNTKAEFRGYFNYQAIVIIACNTRNK